MPQLLQLGSSVQSASGHACKVESFLGGGGQGEVYRAQLGGQAIALKWYFPEQATPAQQKNLETLISKGPPNAQFLWPMELAGAPGVAGFGYLMPLRQPRYKSIVDLMKRRIEPTFQVLATAGTPPCPSTSPALIRRTWSGHHSGCCTGGRTLA